MTGYEVAIALSQLLKLLCFLFTYTIVVNFA